MEGRMDVGIVRNICYKGFILDKLVRRFREEMIFKVRFK